MEKHLYIQLNLVTLIICCILFFHNREEREQVRGNDILQKMTAFTGLAATIDTLVWQLEGSSFPGAGMLYFIVLEIQLVLQILPCLYLLFYLQGGGKNKIKYRVLRHLPLIWVVLLVIVNIFYPIVFYLDEWNCYQRMAGFFLLVCAPFIYLFWSFGVCLIQSRRSSGSEREEYRFVGRLVLFTIAGVVIQMLAYGTETIWMMTALGLISVFIYIQKNREIRIIRETEEMKVAIMCGQLQAHFIFNTLSTIGMYCTDKPQYASNALEKFEKYLRYNIESVTRKSLVYFQEELEHVKNYLMLEKMRFGSFLSIDYKLQETDFFIPALTMQPLTEYIVRKGICNGIEPVKIVIETVKTGDEIRIVLRANETAINSEIQNHMRGMKEEDEQSELLNVRKRIREAEIGDVEYVCNGKHGIAIIIRILESNTNGV